MNTLFKAMLFVLLTSSLGWAQMGGGGHGHGGTGSQTGDRTGDCTGDGLGTRSGGQGMGDQNGPMGGYDLNAIISIEGTVIEANIAANDSGRTRNQNQTGLILETADGAIYYVMTAPFWYLDQQEITFEVGDFIAVTGSLVEGYDHDVLLSATIIQNEFTFVLRDELGYPLWTSMRPGFMGQNLGFPLMDYDLANETIIQAVVTDLFVCELVPGTHPAYQVMVEDTAGNQIAVMLAPYWYLTNQGFSLEIGSEVTLTGAYFERQDGTEILLTRVLEWNDIQLVLRDEEGYPLWSSYRMGGQGRGQ